MEAAAVTRDRPIAGHAGGHESIVKASGYFGLTTAAAAWYASMAAVCASTFGRPILPNPSLKPEV